MNAANASTLHVPHDAPGGQSPVKASVPIWEMRRPLEHSRPILKVTQGRLVWAKKHVHGKSQEPSLCMNKSTPKATLSFNLPFQQFSPKYMVKYKITSQTMIIPQLPGIITACMIGIDCICSLIMSPMSERKSHGDLMSSHWFKTKLTRRPVVT